MKKIRTLALLPLLLLAMVAQAQSLSSGTVNTMETYVGSAYLERITLTGVSTMCTSGPNWAYLDGTENGYKGVMSKLYIARTLKATVDIYSSVNGSGCKIVDVVLKSY